MNRKATRLNVRHDQLVEYVSAKGRASVEELARRFRVSLATVRRDLIILERAGRLNRTHGGAIPSRTGVIEFAFSERGELYSKEKQAIGREVAEMIERGSTVALDSGTTTLEVAKALGGVEGLTVLTSSLAIASVLYGRRDVELVLLGGTAREDSPDLTGWLTEENLKRFLVDYAVVGADGVTGNGVYTRAMDLARICQAVLSAGRKSILVADHSKMGTRSFSRYASLSQFDQVVTDTGVSSATRKWLSRAARDVVYVKPEAS